MYRTPLWLWHVSFIQETNCQTLETQGVPIAIALREEPWGDRHFAIIAPNGIGIDIVTYSAPE